MRVCIKPRVRAEIRAEIRTRTRTRTRARVRVSQGQGKCRKFIGQKSKVKSQKSKVKRQKSKVKSQARAARVTEREQSYPNQGIPTTDLTHARTHARTKRFPGWGSHKGLGPPTSDPKDI